MDLEKLSEEEIEDERIRLELLLLEAEMDKKITEDFINFPDYD